MLAIAVLSILVTAPLGAWGTKFLAPLMLECGHVDPTRRDAEVAGGGASRQGTVGGIGSRPSFGGSWRKPGGRDRFTGRPGQRRLHLPRQVQSIRIGTVDGGQRRPARPGAHRGPCDPGGSEQYAELTRVRRRGIGVRFPGVCLAGWLRFAGFASFAGGMTTPAKRSRVTGSRGFGHLSRLHRQPLGIFVPSVGSRHLVPRSYTRTARGARVEWSEYPPDT